MAASTARHETRALLRAHLAAAMNYRHRTEHCPICRRLLLLAMEPESDHGAAPEPDSAPPAVRIPEGPREGPTGGCAAAPTSSHAEPGTEHCATEDESPPIP
ncbi:DUF6274 family protein [Streptomyces sp. NPDC004111]|uniref:DUF6274 family protein n=1 Tax=Streptomyces sp. NPDC004111 TaxID=3364690 RepID=UPI00367A75EA